jgi:hypothetical protein
MSKLEVDKIDPQSGTALEIGSSGDTITIPAGATFDSSAATNTLPATVVTTDGTQTLTNKSIATTQLTGTITPSDGTVTTAKLADDAVTLAKMASGTDGNIISYDASGNPVAVATGTDGQVLTSSGAGSPPAFETLPSSNPYTAQSNTESGYIKLVGGVIIQWGLFGTFGIASTGTVTFPTTFPSNCWTVTTGLWNNNSDALNSLVVARTPSTSQFTWYQGNTGNTGRVGAYIAVGK